MWEDIVSSAGVHDLTPAAGGQLPLWLEPEDRLSQRDQAVDAIREKYGMGAVLRAPLVAPAETWVTRVFAVAPATEEYAGAIAPDETVVPPG